MLLPTCDLIRPDAERCSVVATHRLLSVPHSSGRDVIVCDRHLATVRRLLAGPPAIRIRPRRASLQRAA